MKSLGLCFLGLVFGWLPLVAQPLALRVVRPLASVERVLIVSIDGLRPDLALLADTPNLHALARSGTYTFWARTTAVAITLPSHTSMVTGVPPEIHGIDWNTDIKPVRFPAVPTIFELARRAGYTTGMVAGKTKFAALDRPGTLSFASIPAEGQDSNAAVIEAAEQMIAAHRPELLFVHFPETDAIGHAEGWGSPKYLAKLEETDRYLGRLLKALEDAQLRTKTVIILTADHGGAGTKHGGPDARSQYIPWIVAGPCVRHGYDLTLQPQRLVRVEDTAATALWLLGVPQPAVFLGQPVQEAFAP